MKVLLDECLPRPLKNSFPEHECRTVPEAGLALWGRGKVGYSALAEGAGFQVFLTIDKGLQYQQNMAGRNIAVVIIRSKSNRLANLFAARCRMPSDHVSSPSLVHSQPRQQSLQGQH